MYMLLANETALPLQTNCSTYYISYKPVCTSPTQADGGAKKVRLSASP